MIQYRTDGSIFLQDAQILAFFGQPVAPPLEVPDRVATIEAKLQAHGW